VGKRDDPGQDQALDAVRRYIEAGIVAIDPAANILRAVPIQSPNGQQAGWFVALVAGDEVAGFVQLGPDLAFRRSATFGLRQSAADWLDLGHVVDQAAKSMRTGEQPGQPYLSYDVSPDRLGWVVPVQDANGNSRRLMVASGSVFELTVGDEGVSRG
jgi:hypothetical protein